MIKELEADGLTDEQIIAIMTKTFNIDKMTAQVIMAIERGESDGDVIELEPGQEAPE